MFPRIQSETILEAFKRDADEECKVFMAEQPLLTNMMLANQTAKSIERLAGMSTLYALLKAQITKGS